MKGFLKAIVVVLLVAIMIPVLSLLGEVIIGILYFAPVILVPILILVVLTFIFNKKKED